MSELCRVVLVALLLMDVHRGVIITSSSSIISRQNADESQQEASTATRQQALCRPPSSDTLWLQLRYRSTGPPVQLSANSDDNADDVEPIVGDDDVTSTNNVNRRRHSLRHGSRRRSRGRLKSTDAIAMDMLGRRGRASKSRSEPSRRQRAWQCKLEKFWRRTGPDVFPAYVQTGRCTTPTCMMGLYECRERRYAVGVLRRRRGRCVPLPLTGANSSSSAAVEELWTPSHFTVVVACECSARRATGVFVRTASSPP